MRKAICSTRVSFGIVNKFLDLINLDGSGASPRARKNSANLTNRGVMAGKDQDRSGSGRGCDLAVLSCFGLASFIIHM
jgi:hypothetical protein